jgi:hypothetical protein
MQRALQDAYQAVERNPLPGAQRGGLLEEPAGVPESSAPITTSQADVAVSVVFDPNPVNDSIVVEVEDPTGKQERYELRRKSERSLPAANAEARDTLSDISIVELDD